MRTLFLLALLFAFFLKPALAATPILDSALPTAPMSYYEDPYGLLDYGDFCNLCQVSWNLCPCDKVSPPFLSIVTTPDTDVDSLSSPLTCSSKTTTGSLPAIPTYTFPRPSPSSKHPSSSTSWHPGRHIASIGSLYNLAISNSSTRMPPSSCHPL